MSIFEGFGFNFYSLALLESVAIWLVSSITFAMVPKKTLGLKILLLTFILSSLFVGGYVFTQGFYTENRFFRIMSLVIITYQHIATFSYINNFPSKSDSKRFKYYVYFLICFSTIVSSYVIYRGINAELFFDFSGQYYEMEMPDAFRIYSVLVIITTFSTIGSVIYKSLKGKKGELSNHRWMIFPIILGFFLPAVLYLLNKTGYIGRSGYITAFSTTGMMAVFMWVIIFINHTEDRTTFLFKIIGVSFSVFILIFGATTYVVFNDREHVYDSDKLLELKFLPEDTSVRSNDIRYMVSYNLDENSFEHDIKNPDIEIEKYTFSSILKSALIVKLNKFENEDAEIEEDFPGELTNDPYVKAYWGFLYKNAPLPQTKISLLNFIPDANTKLFYKYNKIKDIPIKNFKEDSLKYLEKQSPSLTGLYDVLVDYIQKSDSDNKSLKKEVMSFFRPAIELNNRNYTLDRTGKKKFVIFHTYFPKYNKIYHTAYSYAGYREFLHEIGVKIFYIFILGVLFFVVGIPLFLSKALVKPLNDLMEGVKKVRKGNLENEVPVRVYDEIGFLALAFNHMVDSIREAKRKLKEYADSLEDKVEERTNELKQTLTQVESLKEQQDGDYFLTTLLLKPFFINEVYDSKTKIDFFVKQKKEFSFRKKQYQIGGDICISQMIELRGRKYIVFLNADAMGKSMQGAGGILVLGAVFQSIIQRTISYKIQSEVSPERWIKMAFKEMHKIFESFDGSMLVSILFGLIEDSTGLVYYINAEHPWLILYRDGVASFIEKELAFRKLGHVGVESEIFVSTFQMEPGDTLIMGSDGKDDLVLDKNPNSRNINEDEFLILKRIEESKGDLNLMFNIITEKYELVDDYSIMSFSYPEIDFEQEAEIQEKIQTYLKKAKSVIVKSNDFAGAIQILEKGMEELGPDKLIMESLIKLTMKVKNYKKAADYCKILLNKNEVDTSILFKASYCLKMNHEFEESIEMSERVKLREPGNIRNLIHLADLYAYTKNYHRSEKLLSKILKFDPNNKQAKLIYEKIQPNN